MNCLVYLSDRKSLAARDTAARAEDAPPPTTRFTTTTASHTTHSTWQIQYINKNLFIYLYLLLTNMINAKVTLSVTFSRLIHWNDLDEIW